MELDNDLQITMLKASVEAYQEQIDELENIVSEQAKEIKNLKDKIYGAKDLKDFNEWLGTKDGAFKAYIEAMASAYYKATQLSPSQVVLKETVMDDDDHSIFYWFEPRDKYQLKEVCAFDEETKLIKT